MVFIEENLFHDIRKNLTGYEKLRVNFIALNPDHIYWKEAF
jgi:hypothetical protein